MFKEILNKLATKTNLTEDEASFSMSAMLNGELNEPEIAAFLMAMRTKGESIEELTTFVKVMRDAAIAVDVDNKGAVDLCGTGGDSSGTFNISTASMFVVAGAGVPVLKHGNRSVSSKSGSSDVLEAIGVCPYLNKEEVEACFKDTGMAFMFAPNFHPALKYVMPVRKALKIRTFFNILGPLLNPANVKHQIIGAYNREMAELIAKILANLKVERAYTVNALDGLDEFSITLSESDVFELRHSLVSESRRLIPEDLGFKRHSIDSILGGDKNENADIIIDILSDKSTDAQRDIVLLNALFAIHVSGKVETLEEAKQLAVVSIKSGNALKKLDILIEASNDLSNK